VRTQPLGAAPDPGASGGNGHFTPDTVVTPYGVRVPTFVVSPWVPPGKGPDIVLDHCSILKTIVARFCGESRPFVSDRVEASRSFDSYLSESQPRTDVPPYPPLPPLPADEPLRRGSTIVTRPVFRRQMRSGNVDFHDLTGMLARMLGRDPR
jgi:Phosphoesterase family